MRRRILLLALFTPLPALGAPPRPTEVAVPTATEPVRGQRRGSLSRGIYRSGSRPHWSRSYTPSARPRSGRF